MKITYKYSNEINEGQVIYRKNENSFDFISNKRGDVSILIGYLQLSIDSLTNQLVSVWGLHPFCNWIDEKLSVPQTINGIVELENDYDSGISYREKEFNEWKTYYDNKNGWVCIGDKNVKGVSIMFASDIVVVIDNNNLKSLWIKPNFQ